AVLLCLQKQTEIATQTSLFHRQTESRIAQALRDTIPYFLGAIGPREVMLQRDLLSAQRALRRAERDLAEAEEKNDVFEGRLLSIASLAVAHSLLNEACLQLDATDLRARLEAVLEEEETLVDSALTVQERERARLNSERGELREQLQLLEE